MNPEEKSGVLSLEEKAASGGLGIVSEINRLALETVEDPLQAPHTWAEELSNSMPTAATDDPDLTEVGFPNQGLSHSHPINLTLSFGECMSADALSDREKPLTITITRDQIKALLEDQAKRSGMEFVDPNHKRNHFVPHVITVKDMWNSSNLRIGVQMITRIPRKSKDHGATWFRCPIASSGSGVLSGFVIPPNACVGRDTPLYEAPKNKIFDPRFLKWSTLDPQEDILSRLENGDQGQFDGMATYRRVAPSAEHKEAPSPTDWYVIRYAPLHWSKHQDVPKEMTGETFKFLSIPIKAAVDHLNNVYEAIGLDQHCMSFLDGVKLVFTPLNPQGWHALKDDAQKSSKVTIGVTLVIRGVPAVGAKHE